MATSRELDTNLLQQFSCLGTTDRDVLISQFQKIIGYQISASQCAFYLDMNNWNLQAAVGSYFDCDSPPEDLPSMSLVQDVTVGEGESIPPSTRFVKTWRIQNTGIKQWPPDCHLMFVSGIRMDHVNFVAVEALRPEEITNVSVEMVSPPLSGTYMGQWRMALSTTGQYFGDMIYVIVTVQEGGLLGVTQQMDAFNQLGSPPRAQPFVNPFATRLLKCGGLTPSSVELLNDDSQNNSMSVDSQQPFENGASASQTPDGATCRPFSLRDYQDCIDPQEVSQLSPSMRVTYERFLSSRPLRSNELIDDNVFSFGVKDKIEIVKMEELEEN